MITIHRINGEEFILNEKHIEIMEARPDTVITLTNDRKYVVKESVSEVLELIREVRERNLLDGE